MSDAGGAGPLSDDEWNQLRGLLHRFCTHELDQWALLQTATPYGPVYISVDRKPLPDTDQFTYHSLYREDERPPD
ncbi:MULTISPECIES: hypothetical protein [Streptomyces]|uniref:Uncharacterized protein n=1 Tax=Streptomyces pini TaxID=1520580 RepID=A0A1I4L6U7_9ACTN|nr:hypothetical protein [Streptomyces pini]SFL86755.1 hypothetical protein SAMN05192584_13019 [Streptomyces pini]